MKAKILGVIAALSVAAIIPSVVYALTLINNGNGTFIDTATGLEWMNISTFYNHSWTQDQSLILPGFSFATMSQVAQLEIDSGLPVLGNPVNGLPGSNKDLSFYQSVAAAMGVPSPTASNRNIIWGLYSPLADGTFQAADYVVSTNNDDAWTWSEPYCGNWCNPYYIYPDLGAFAVNTEGSTNPIPLPGTFPLLASGLAALVLLRWRGKRKAEM